MFPVFPVLAVTLCQQSAQGGRGQEGSGECLLVICILTASQYQQYAQGGGMQAGCGEFLSHLF